MLKIVGTKNAYGDDGDACLHPFQSTAKQGNKQQTSTSQSCQTKRRLAYMGSNRLLSMDHHMG